MKLRMPRMNNLRRNAPMILLAAVAIFAAIHFMRPAPKKVRIAEEVEVIEEAPAQPTMSGMNM